jgi:hypothetical protein
VEIDPKNSEVDRRESFVNEVSLLSLAIKAKDTKRHKRDKRRKN